MDRIEVNVETGDVQIIPLTPDEIAAAQAATAAEQAALAAKPKSPPAASVDAINALGPILGATPAQIQQAIAALPTS